MSLARRHRQAMLAATATLVATPAGEQLTGPAGSEYELLKARLGVDLRRLKDVQSIERKVALKRELAPAYGPWVKGKLDADAGGDDVIVTHMLIWAIDVGEFPDAIEIARYVLKHKLPLPERFDRTAATLIVEEIAEAALKRLGQGETFDLDILHQVENLAEGEDIFDQVRAKLEKAIGLHSAREAEAIAADADGPAGARRAGLAAAEARLRRALTLDPAAGVKKRADALAREIAKIEETPA